MGGGGGLDHGGGEHSRTGMKRSISDGVCSTMERVQNALPPDCAVMVSSLTSMATMRGSLFTAMLIPSLQDSLQILDDQATDTIQFARRETIIV